MVNAAIGDFNHLGVIHLLAIAGRIGVDRPSMILTGSLKNPLLANLQPSGNILWEDFYYTGGLPAIMKELLLKLHRTCITVNGSTVEDNVARRPVTTPQ